MTESNKNTGINTLVKASSSLRKASCPRTSCRGFILVEVLVVTAIIAIVFLIASVSFIKGSKLREIADANTELHLKGKNAMDLMVEELKNATRTAPTSPPNISIPTSENILFYLPGDIDGDGYIIDSSGNTEWSTGGTLQYQFVSAQNQLVRWEGTQQRILTENVSSVTFNDVNTDLSLDIDEVKITMSLFKNISEGRIITLTLVALVKLRN